MYVGGCIGICKVLMFVRWHGVDNGTEKRWFSVNSTVKRIRKSLAGYIKLVKCFVIIWL
jgi:hypothetical protein